MLLHFVQLVIVSGEERAGLSARMLMQILHDGPRNGDAVIRGSASSKLVEEH